VPNYAEYFELNRYKPKYQIGDRVFGHYQKIPFVGSVGNDTVINDIEGPRVSVHLDLPMKIQDGFRSVIIVKHKDIQLLKDYDDDSGIQRAAAKKRK
jgi:hypothetical protein